MQIIVGKTAGFCYGVERAVEEAKKELLNGKNIYCLGEIVHNKSVIEELEKNGMIFVENVDDVSNEMIVRAHGTTKNIYEELKERKIEIKDLTCPNVLKTHQIAEEYSIKDYYIILIGIKNHPESIGTLSFCGKNAILMQEEEDFKEGLEKIEKSGINNVLIMAQTTYNSKKFDNMVQKLQNLLCDKNIEIKKTICGATEIRQKETIELSKNVEIMIIVGDKKSSNTNKLYDISMENCKNVFFIQNSSELKKEQLINAKKIGIMAGASTPKEDIEDVVKWIKNTV